MMPVEDRKYATEVPLPTAMQLRDYFAGQALAGTIARMTDAVAEHSWAKVARAAYGLADAMIKERAGR